MRKPSHSLLTLSLVLLAVPELAWSGAGHMVTAVEAYRQLSLEVQRKVTEIPKSYPGYGKSEASFVTGAQGLNLASTWPDKIHRRHNAYVHPLWHGIDYPLKLRFGLWDGCLELIRLWQRWGSEGPEPLSAAILWGHHLFFWARLGKVLEFIAALAIIADIIGPERLRLYGEWLQKTADSGSPKKPLSRFALSVLNALAAPCGGLNWILILVAWVLERPNADKWIKTASLLLLMTGFHFDLLAS